jgi:hypothetical protein
MKLVLVFFIIFAMAPSGLSETGTESPPQSPSVAQLVEDLYSTQSRRVAHAKERLLKLARQSPEERSEVVRRLLGVLDDVRTGTTTTQSTLSRRHSLAQRAGSARSTAGTR